MFKADNIELFILLFIPGFISLKIYQLIVPTEKVDFSKSVYEVVGFSVLNFGFFYWLILIAEYYEVKTYYQWLYYGMNFIMVFIAPILWPLAFYKLSRSKFFRKNAIDPVKSPWDAFFSQRIDYWVVVHLKNGESLGGRYAEKSHTSVYPAKEQIYLEELWRLNEDGGFESKIQNTAGVLILGDEISRIEFIN